jgi:serine/threonine protein kinase
MARLSHANVVQIHDVGVQDDRVFLAMELVVGETLTRWLEESPRSWREVVRVFVAAARGLAAAHRAGLVHRDFKPDNVLMGDDGQPRVADFGLAREDRPALAEASAEATQASRGLLVDTVDGDGRGDGDADVHVARAAPRAAGGAGERHLSFSVALFEALHGARPFGGRHDAGAGAQRDDGRAGGADGQAHGAELARRGGAARVGGRPGGALSGL